MPLPQPAFTRADSIVGGKLRRIEQAVTLGRADSGGGMLREDTAAVTGPFSIVAYAPMEAWPQGRRLNIGEAFGALP